MSNIYGSYTGSAQNISNTNSADVAYAELKSQIVALDVRVTANDTDIAYNESRIDTLETEMDAVQNVTSIFTPDTPSIGTTTVETNLDMGYLTLTGVGQVDWRADGQAGRVYGYINPAANNEFLMVNTLANGSSQSSFFSFYTRNIITAVLKPLRIFDDTVNFFTRSITNCSTIDTINADLTAVKTKTDLFTLNSPVYGTTRISTSFDLNYKNITNIGTLQTTSASVGGQVRSYINGTDGDYVISNELIGSDTFISFVTRSIGGVLSYFRVRNTTVDFNSRSISNCPTTTAMGSNITINSSAISAIQTVNATQTTAINSLDTRLTSAETVNTTQNTRLTAVETVNATQDTRLTAVESVNTTQNTRLTAVESVNTSQSTAITANASAISAHILKTPETIHCMINSVLIPGTSTIYHQLDRMFSSNVNPSPLAFSLVDTGQPGRFGIKLNSSFLGGADMYDVVIHGSGMSRTDYANANADHILNVGIGERTMVDSGAYMQFTVYLSKCGAPGSYTQLIEYSGYVHIIIQLIPRAR